MSLYDDIDSGQRSGTERVPGWGSANIKLLQSQLKLRKAAVGQPRGGGVRRPTSMAPVIDLKGKRDDEEMPVLNPLALNAQVRLFLVPRGQRLLSVPRG